MTGSRALAIKKSKICLASYFRNPGRCFISFFLVFHTITQARNVREKEWKI